MGGFIDKKPPLLPGVETTEKDGLKSYLSYSWKPQLTIIGFEGLPDLSNCGNVLNPTLTLGLSLRLPPNFDCK